MLAMKEVGAGEVFKAHSAMGDCHGEMNHQMILKWLNKVIPILFLNSVLVRTTRPTTTFR